MLVEIPVRFVVVHFNDNRGAQLDFKMARQAYTHAPDGAVKIKIGIPLRGIIDLGCRVILVCLVSPVPMGRGMGRWSAAGRLVHRHAAGRIHITGREKKREKSPDQNGKKSLRIFHLFSSRQNDCLTQYLIFSGNRAIRGAASSMLLKEGAVWFRSAYANRLCHMGFPNWRACIPEKN